MDKGDKKYFLNYVEDVDPVKIKGRFYKKIKCKCECGNYVVLFKNNFSYEGTSK